MSKIRHKGSKGPNGKMPSLPAVTDAYAGGNSQVAKHAKEKKRGGAVQVEGGKGKVRMDKPKRASGGRVGANTRPFSTAANISKTAES